MLQVKTESFVLEKEHGYNDEGQILLFSREFGLTRAIASGICKSNSRLAAWTEPPALITADLSIQEDSQWGRRLLTLSPKNYFPQVKAGYENLRWFWGYVGILNYFLPKNTPLPKLYPIWGKILSRNGWWENANARNLNFAFFITQLLKHEGLLPDWRYCSSCEKSWLEKESGFFVVGKEGLLCRKCSSQISISELQSNLTRNVIPDFLNIFSPEKELVLPKNILRVPLEERKILEKCKDSDNLDKILESIFSHSKINDQVLCRVRNFLLIFLNSIL